MPSPCTRSGGIAAAKGGVPALVHLGASFDVAGGGYDTVAPELIEQVLAEYPRLQFKRTMHDLLVAAVRRKPTSYGATWLADLAREELGVPLPSVHARLAASPFSE